jgi:dUTP pyrophosphatase
LHDGSLTLPLRERVYVCDLASSLIRHGSFMQASPVRIPIVLDKQAAEPLYATELAAGMDLRACLEAPIVLAPGARVLVPTGIRFALPVGYEGQVRPRSGLALKHGITVLNSPGTIDADYRGEVSVLLINLGTDAFTIAHGDRIAQLVVHHFERVAWDVTETLSATERGTSGYGSTGSK